MSLLSSFLGLDASHNAGVAQTNATNQIARQNQFGDQAAGVYSGLQQAGAGQAGAYQGNYLQLLNEFGGMAGLGTPITQTRQPPAANVPGQAPTQGTLASTLNGRTATPGQGQDQQQGPNPYGLDHNQQQLLNQSIAQIGQSQKAASSAFAQQMQRDGITDPRDLAIGHQQIEEHFTALSETTQAQFYEQVKTDKMKALQEIMSGLQTYGSQGIAEQEAAGSGYLGLAAGAQNAVNSSQQQSLEQQQLSNNQLGGALSLLSFGLGGGFGGGGGAAPIFDAGIGGAPLSQAA